MDDITTKGKNIADVVRGIIKMREKIKTETKLVKAQELEYEKMLEELGVCPLCGQEIKK